MLALFLLTVIWLDRTQPVIAPGRTYALLGVYAATSTAILALTWNSWWLEAKLAEAVHAFDLIAFLWLNYATQGYASPFFAFYVFLIFSATIRWGWRGTAATAAVIIVLYIASGVTAASWGTAAFEWQRFALRSSYLVTLTSLTILWNASTTRSAEAPIEPADLRGGRCHADVSRLVAAAAQRFRARRAIFVWSEKEEPWTYVSRLDEEGFAETRLEPGTFEPLVSPAAGAGPFLFDQRRGRILCRGAKRKLARPLANPLHPALAAEYAIADGLRVPVRSDAVEGEMLILDVPGLCPDDLARAQEMAGQLTRALEHGELIQATEEAAEMRARLSLARDLHDSTVQFLAGLALRLEGLRKRAMQDGGISQEIDALQGELSREQQDLRRFIAELRGSGSPPLRDRAELVASLCELTGRIAAQWDVACRVVAPAEIEVPTTLERNVRQLVREAVANAVRHGGATNIETRLARSNGSLEVEIADNGSGFPVRGELQATDLAETGPTSLRERVENLGGRLRVASTPSGSRLRMALPLEEAT